MTLKDKMLAVIADINASVAEREELVEMIAIALLTRKTCSFWAPPGRPKAMLSIFSASILPAPVSLNVCSLSRVTRSSFSAV